MEGCYSTYLIDRADPVQHGVTVVNVNGRSSDIKDGSASGSAPIPHRLLKWDYHCLVGDVDMEFWV